MTVHRASAPCPRGPAAGHVVCQLVQEDRMFAADVPTYLIDLGKAEAERWEEVISREKTVARRLIQEAGTEFGRVPELLRWVFARLYQTFGGLSRGQIAAC